MWKSCLYCCGPYTFTCSILLFIMFGMLQDGSWTFEVLAAKHEWDVAEKARCCRNAAIFYLCVSLLLMVLAAIDSFVLDLSQFCDGSTRASTLHRLQRNGFRATMAGCWAQIHRRFTRGAATAQVDGIQGSAGVPGAMGLDGVSQTSSFAGHTSVLNAAHDAEEMQRRRDAEMARSFIATGSPVGADPGAAMNTDMALSSSAVSPGSFGFVAAPHSPAVVRTASLLFRNASLTSPMQPPSPQSASTVTTVAANSFTHIYSSTERGSRAASARNRSGPDSQASLHPHAPPPPAAVEETPAEPDTTSAPHSATTTAQDLWTSPPPHEGT